MADSIALPEPFLQRLDQHLGVEGKQLAQALHEPATLAVRYNPLKPGNAFEGEPVPWCPEGVYLKERPSFVADPRWHAGQYYVQEASSMFLTHVLRHLPKPEMALDLCAAPGGKSTLLATHLDGEGWLVANEVIRKRASILRENLVKWGKSNVTVTNSDPKDFARLGPLFDLILVDAPCSGEGLFRKDPDSVATWNPELVGLCSARQKRILYDAVEALAPGGHLIYSTCTYEPEENERMVAWMGAEFGLESVPIPIEPFWNLIEHPQGGGYGFWPHRTRGEGFFVACLRKHGEKSQPRFPKGTGRWRPVKTRDWGDWVDLPNDQLVLTNPQQEQVAVPDWVVPYVYLFDQKLNVLQAGLEIGQVAGKKKVPSHQLALSDRLGEVSRWELSREEALTYLQKKDLRHTSGIEPGWTVVCYEGLTLGWVKVLPNRVNNYYPKNYRIRKDLSQP